MTFGTTKRIAIIAVLFSASILTSCLTKEDSEMGFSGGGQQTQNSPPTISGNPQSAVMMGSSYSFTPTASDPDGDNLTFSVQNLPGWANFDNSSGTLAGKPTLANVGVYADIQITVSDGSLSSSLPRYSVNVVQTALGSVTLSWTPPTQNEDGSALVNLAGYKFYYGTVSGTYPNSIRIDNSGIASYVIENLTPDTYYFVATAFNSIGIESRYSNETIKIVSTM